MENKKLKYLDQQINLANKASDVLTYTYDQIGPFFPLDGHELQPDTLERLDALTSRFARLSDILIQKVFRAIDAIELIDEGSLIDRLHRAEKRNIIADANMWKDIRELRNQIAHEYVLSDVNQLFSQVHTYVPELLNTLTNIKEYTVTFKSKQND